MRYATPIYLMDVTKGVYNAQTGNYTDDIISEKLEWCSIPQDLSSKLRLEQAEVYDGTVTIHMQHAIPAGIERVRIGDTVYSIEQRKERLLTKKSYILREVQT